MEEQRLQEEQQQTEAQNMELLELMEKNSHAMHEIDQAISINKQKLSDIKNNLNDKDNDCIEQDLDSLSQEIKDLEHQKRSLKKRASILKHEEISVRKQNANVLQRRKTIKSRKSIKLSEKTLETTKKYDVMRAGVLQKHTLQLKSIRQRQQLIDTTQLAAIQKLKLKQQFKKKLAKIKLELNKHGINSGFEAQMKVNIGPLFHNNGGVVFDATSNGQYIASVGQMNGILHVRDWNDESLFMMSLLEQCSPNTSFEWYVSLLIQVLD